MHDLLILADKEVEKHAERGALSPEILLQIEQDYQQILTEGFAYHASLPRLPAGKRGRQKQRDGKNLS
jgi:transposase